MHFEYSEHIASIRTTKPVSVSGEEILPILLVGMQSEDRCYQLRRLLIQFQPRADLVHRNQRLHSVVRKFIVIFFGGGLRSKAKTAYPPPN